jgi:4-amino-4-deoxy-L-arabinose transferase-like glycosyltransferase
MATFHRYLLGLIAGLYLLLAGQYALLTPAWQVPDEPAHYNYIRQIAEEGRLPIIKTGDWDSDYQARLISSGFASQYTGEMGRIEYEDHQPPLYYLLASPVYALSGGDLRALRLFSVLIGLGVVVGCYLLLQRLWPQQPFIPPAATAVLAFIPQHLAMLGGVNNDPLAELCVVLVFWRALVYLEADEARPRAALWLGLAVGLALLTKSTVYFLGGIGFLTVLLHWQRNREGLGRQMAAFLIPALLLGGLWWGRNLAVYGGGDFLGLQHHDEVAAGQLQRADYVENTLGGDQGQYAENLLTTAFHSFWGQFGWMAVPMEIRVYRILLLFCGLLLLGNGLYVWQSSGWRALGPVQKEMLALFALTAFFVLAAFLLYNRQFVQFQGRYLFPALMPFGLWVAIGAAGWCRLLRPWWPGAWPGPEWGSLVAGLLIALLAAYALHNYLLPNLPEGPITETARE